MQIVDFISESNRIEGIKRYPLPEEIEQYETFISYRTMSLARLEGFVRVFQPNTRLRNQHGLNVRVGKHTPIAGSPLMGNWVTDLLSRSPNMTPYQLHVEYETLHPFTDCNGRSGRALWHWHMLRKNKKVPLGFLHHFYYQALDGARL